MSKPQEDSDADGGCLLAVVPNILYLGLANPSDRLGEMA